MTSSKDEETLRFFQYVEDSGLRAYNGLITQNLDHARNERNRIYIQEKNDKKRKQEEVIKRTGEDVVTEGKQLRMGSMTMPAPTEHAAHHHPHHACGPGFTVRSQSLHSVGGGGCGGGGGGGEEEVGSPTSRKQPPPKPRRDPATKLSISSETVDHSPTSWCRGGSHPDSERCEGESTQGCSDDCRRIPPPKPKRNPNTQLSISFDESYIRNPGGSKGHSPSESDPSPPQSESPTHHSDSDEPVYIEMGGSAGQELPRSEDEELDESVYEEMKYPALDELDYRWDPPGCRSACPTPAPPDADPLSRCSTPRNIPLCDIPAPFPNLLTHRPPLLVFPPAPAQCSPNSDESPLTPLDMAKLPMLDNASGNAYSKSPTSSSSEPPSAHLRRELTATPTLTVSGRSSAPPLPCTLYKSSSSSSSSSYQRSHSACPSPVSMARCLTPLSLMRPPPFDAAMPFPGGLPRSASATPHGKGSPPQDCLAGARLHGSMQNVSTGRSRTPTSPLDELTNLFTTGRNMLKKNSSGRKSKEPGETESKSKSHGESKRDGKERHSHSKESKRESKERSSHHKESSHRRESKDRGCSSVEPVPKRSTKDRGCNSVEPLPVRRDSRDRGCNSVEPLPVRRDSRDRGCNSVEPLPVRRDSRDRGCNSVEPLPVRRDSRDRGCNSVEPLMMRRDSKDRGCNSVELMPRRDSKDRIGHVIEPRQDSKDRIGHVIEPRQDSKDTARNGAESSRHDSKERIGHPPELLPRQDSKDRVRNGMDSRHDSKERMDQPPDLLPRQDSKDFRSGLECRRNSKERGNYGMESRHEGKDRGYNGVEPLPRQDSKELARNGIESRHDSKDRGLPPGLDQPRRDRKDKSTNGVEARQIDSKDRGSYSIEQSKAQEKNAVSGQQSSTATPTRHGRPSGSLPMALGTGNTELKAAPKYSLSPSTPVTPSPMGTPQRQVPEAAQTKMPQMPWMCGDSTMLEMIERKRTLCIEIRSRQQRPPPPDVTQCKQESWGKSNGSKKIRPPPYPTQTTVFWDTAI